MHIGVTRSLGVQYNPGCRIWGFVAGLWFLGDKCLAEALPGDELEHKTATLAKRIQGSGGSRGVGRQPITISGYSCCRSSISFGGTCSGCFWPAAGAWLPTTKLWVWGCCTSPRQNPGSINLVHQGSTQYSCRCYTKFQV